MTNTKDGDMTDPKEFACPHCGDNEGTWFDRTCDAYGGRMTTRCNTCGKDVDERKDVDMDVVAEIARRLKQTVAPENATADIEQTAGK